VLDECQKIFRGCKPPVGRVDNSLFVQRLIFVLSFSNFFYDTHD